MSAGTLVADHHAHSVTVVVSRHVPAANMAAFEAVMHELMQHAADHQGHISGEVFRGPPGPGGRDYHAVYRFTDPETLRAWEFSDDRQALLAKLEPLTTGQSRRELTGLEAWFDLPGAAAPPPRNRMALLTWVALWPTVSLILAGVLALGADWPFLVRTGATTAIAVVLMTYVVMPRLTRAAMPWLRARG